MKAASIHLGTETHYSRNINGQIGLGESNIDQLPGNSPGPLICMIETASHVPIVREGACEKEDGAQGSGLLQSDYGG